MKGKLIVFEGMDNTGKTSVSKEFTKLLKNSEYSNDAIWTCQPGSDYGEHSSFIKRMCKDKDLPLNKVSRMLSFMIDRSEQIDKIITPELSNGNDVICDRWAYSTHAYQLTDSDIKESMRKSFDRKLKGYDYPQKMQKVDELLDYFIQVGTLEITPDIVFYFPQELDNKREIPENDFYENTEDLYKNKVRRAYNKLARGDNWITVYPENSVKETVKKCFYYYKDFINKSKRHN